MNQKPIMSAQQLSVFDQDRDNELKKRIQDVMHKYNIKQVDVARETGLPHSTLSLWLQGKIKGHMVKIADAIEGFVDNFMSNKPRMNTTHISKFSLLKSPANKFEDGDWEPAENDFGMLIPIKLDIEIEGQRLKENFLWDKNEPYITLESFAKLLVDENNLSQGFEADIVQQMKRQVKDFRGYKVMTAQVPQSVGSGAFTQVNLEQIRVIKLNVRVGKIVCRDQFEWDINNPDNSPEQFAECLCTDMGFGPEFLLPIAFQIREKILELQKIAYAERRQKSNGQMVMGASELSFIGKNDGSYSQTRYGQSYQYLPLQNNHIGLQVGQFRTENKMPLQINNVDHDQLMKEDYKTMIRSLETVQDTTAQRRQANYFKSAPFEDEFQGWGPEVQIIEEAELKKIEKQEDRESRYRKRRTR